jgi:hypothetical protein
MLHEPTADQLERIWARVTGDAEMRPGDYRRLNDALHEAARTGEFYDECRP